MKRYFIYLSYDGTNYHGWQIQPNGMSVQEELEHALTVLLRETISVTGAGRTDAGVHARMMVAHFDTPQEVDTQQLTYKLNKFLRQSIAIQKIIPVATDMHARFSATARTYRYFIHTRKDPFENAYSCLLLYPLDFSLMNEAAKILMEYDDFGKIDQYLEKNGPSPAHEISRGTGVPTARVRELLVEGRLEARAGQEGLLDSDLGPKNESIKSHQKGTYMENKHKEQERMRFLDN